MSAAELRYPRATLWADYVRAAMGVVLCGGPLVALNVNRWMGLLLGAGLLLFLLFLARTALRQRTRYVLADDTLCADGPAGTLVEWRLIDRFKLNYYSTKRDRTEGWMQLSLGSAGGRTIKIDSALEGFYDIVERAAVAAEANGVELGAATRANLKSMGIAVAELEKSV